MILLLFLFMYFFYFLKLIKNIILKTTLETSVLLCALMCLSSVILYIYIYIYIYIYMLIFYLLLHLNYVYLSCILCLPNKLTHSLTHSHFSRNPYSWPSHVSQYPSDSGLQTQNPAMFSLAYQQGGAVPSTLTKCHNEMPPDPLLPLMSSDGCRWRIGWCTTRRR